MNENDVREMREWLAEYTNVEYLLEKVYCEGHRRRGLSVGHPEVNAEAVKAEHDATMADMDALYLAWQQKYPDHTGFLFKQVRKDMDDVYAARTNPPLEEADTDPRWTAGYEMGKGTGRGEMRADLEEAQRIAADVLEANDKLVARAVKAEHEATVGDMDASIKGYPDHGSRGIGEFARGHLLDKVRMQMELEYQARTNPKPDMVTVRMSQKDFDRAVLACGVLELVDPPGESETEKEKT